MRYRSRLQPRRCGPIVAPMVVVLLLVACGDGGEPEAQAALPEIDTGGMEPQVAARIAAARDAVTAEPASAAAWGGLGMVLQAHALIAEAVPCYREAERLDADDPRWPYFAALALKDLDLEAASSAFSRAARLTPASPAFYIAYGDTLAELGRSEEGKTAYRTALTLDAESTHALYGLAQLAHAEGESGRARELLERAAQVAPHHGEVQALLAQVLEQLGEEEAARHRELLAAANPDATRAPDPWVEAMEAEAVSSRAYTARGLRQVREGRFAEAETSFRRVLEIRPGNARDYSNLGGALARQGKLEEALVSYRQALELDPDDPQTRNNLAMALAERGDPRSAVAELERAVALDPAYAEAHHNLGLMRAGLGDLERAVAHYREALRLKPAYGDASTSLGTALARLGRLEEAIDVWRQTLEVDPRQVSAIYNLSVALAGSGRHAEAVARLRRGVAIAPNSSRLVSLLAWELATAPRASVRNGEEAVELARRVQEAYPGDAAAADLLAAALAEAGDLEGAERMGERALELSGAGGDAGLMAQMRARLEGYRAGRPYRNR